jgi:Ca-activated chloride channel homolog
MLFFFDQPFWLLLLFPLLIVCYYMSKRDSANVNWRLPSASDFASLESNKRRLARWADGLLPLSIAALIVALARPQMPDRAEAIKTIGIDIMLVLDISPSMLAQDFTPNRLEVAKSLAIDFINKRPYDRIGLVTFWREALTQCPLTTDQDLLIKTIQDLSFDVEQQGTAIGLALATAINRIKESPSKSKVIVFLTDGKEELSNGAYITPIAAANLAHEHQIRVYTIGIGTNGMALMPQFNQDGEIVSYQMQEVDVDEATLTRIADLSSNGKFFRALDNKGLEKIYDEINQLEKHQLDAKSLKKKQEYYSYFLIFAIASIIIYLLLHHFYFNLLS